MTDLQKTRVEKLCAALESGKYLPGQRRLRQHILPDGENKPVVNPDGPKDLWCCLGIACEIYRLETGDGQWMGLTTQAGLKTQFMGFFASDFSEYPAGRLTETAYLPQQVSEWYGFDRDNPEIFESCGG